MSRKQCSALFGDACDGMRTVFEMSQEQPETTESVFVLVLVFSVIVILSGLRFRGDLGVASIAHMLATATANRYKQPELRTLRFCK